MIPEKEISKIILALFEKKFEFPMTLVMIGINGSHLVAKFEMLTITEKNVVTTKFKNSVLSGKAENLRFPINAMFVDARGIAAHILIKNADKLGDLTFLSGEIDVLPVPLVEPYPRA